MATLIICPACGTRYQIKAAFPPEGRKVRCAKCSHVWQAQPAEAEAAPPPPAAPQPPAAAPAPAAPAPQPVPQAPPAAAPAPPPPQAPSAPQGVPVPPQAAPQAPAQAPLPPEMPPAAPPSAEAGAAYPPAGQAPGAVPPSPPEPDAGAKGGLFGKLMGKTKSATSEAPPEMAPPPDMAPPADQAPLGGAAPGAEDASFDATFPGIDDGPAAADANLAAEAFGESLSSASAPGEKKKPPVVAIGWGILGVIVLGVLGLFFLAPQTTVSILPGASHLYSMLGMQVGTQGLQFEGVRYGWTNSGGQNVLEVQGSVRNTSASSMSVPTVIIVLRDENGEEISEWTTEVGAAELAPDEDAPFLKQIPAPPSNVRSLKVRFAQTG